MKHLSSLSPEQQSSALELIKAATDLDGVPPMAEHVILHLRHGGDKSDSHLVIEKDNHVIAYAHLDKTDLVAGPSVEVVVHPTQRGQGFGTQLLKEVLEIFGDKARIWSHGDLPQAHSIAEKLGLVRLWANLQMSKQLKEIVEITSKYLIRSFLPGIDDESFLDLNNKVFAHHPDQGRWSKTDLAVRIKEEWFDDKGFFVCEDKEKLIGFCWTKIHGAHTHSHEGKGNDLEAIGEIYVLAVDPTYQGKGIGKNLTTAGLNYLRSRGLSSVMLYVGIENKAAINLYKSLGFIDVGSDVMYRVKG